MRIERLRRLEGRGRWVLLRALAGAAGRGGPVPPHAWPLCPRRLLFVRNDAIGDMIMSTGLLRALARAQGGVTVDVLTSPANVPVLAGNPHVRRVIPFRKGVRRSYPGVLRRLRAAGYDAVVDGMIVRPSVSSSTALVILAARAPWRVGVGGRAHDFLYSVVVEPAPHGVHHVEALASLAVPFGLDVATGDWSPELWLSDAERGEARRQWAMAGAAETPDGGGRVRLLVNVSVARARGNKQWPDERYVRLLRHARAHAVGPAVAVIGAPEDRARVEQLAALGGVPAVATPHLREALAMVATADVVLTPDTALAHAAAAFRTPAVVMLLPRFAAFVPYRAPGRNVFADNDESLASLPAERVMTAVDGALAGGTVPVPRAGR